MSGRKAADSLSAMSLFKTCSTKKNTRNGKLISWSQPPGAPSIHSRRVRVKLPNKREEGLPSAPRNG